MFTFLSVAIVCFTIIIVVILVQKDPITIVIHKKIEEINKPVQVNSVDDIEDKDQDTLKGMQELIQFTQDFLGGEVDAESEHKAK